MAEEERVFFDTVVAAAFANPFSQERNELDRRITELHASQGGTVGARFTYSYLREKGCSNPRVDSVAAKTCRAGHTHSRCTIQRGYPCDI